jgi:hypothetical protein
LFRELVYLLESEKNEFSNKFKTIVGTVFDLKKEQLVNRKAYTVHGSKAIIMDVKLNELLNQVIYAKKYSK